MRRNGIFETDRLLAGKGAAVFTTSAPGQVIGIRLFPVILTPVKDVIDFISALNGKFLKMLEPGLF